MLSNKIDKTKNIYGLLWTRKVGVQIPKSYHFNKMQEVISEKILRGSLGIDVGSGCGYDTYIMAKSTPSIKIVSIDISAGVTTNSKVNRDLRNVYVMKGTVLNTPLKEEIFDFAYSFGVLHHTPDPTKGLLEIRRILKKESPVFLYLYEDHSENILKYTALKVITFLRKITIKIPPKALYILAFIASPFIFIFFSCPAIILNKFKATRRFAENMPFNFGKSPFYLQGDLYDRFGAPIEYRFSKKEIYNLLDKCNFYKIHITKLKATAGWVVWAYKNPDIR